MASLDFVYDFSDQAVKQNIDYLLITLEKSKKNGKIDVFYSLQDKNSLKMLAKGLDMFNKDMDKKQEQEDEDEDE